MTTLKLLIVDDNMYIRDGIKLSLRKGNWQTNIDEACNGLEALNLAKSTDYDLVLMDISMPVMDGREALTKILEVKPTMKIVMVSMHSAKDEIELLKKNGAKGYILKDDVAKDIITVINRVVKGESVFDLTYY